MKMNAYIAGVGMTPFGNHIAVPLKTLAGKAVTKALEDSGLEASDIEAAYMSNAAGGQIVGQAMISGQVALRELGIGHIPVINVENACASASTALNQAATMITAGIYDVVLACGYEKLFHEDKAVIMSVFSSGVDVENPAGLKGLLYDTCTTFGIEPPDQTHAAKRSAFMDIYAVAARYHMENYGTTQEDFAAVSAKNSFHGSLNPNAQFRERVEVEDVLAAREIIYPLTLPMCSPIGDGAAATILISEKKARELGLINPVRVMSSVLGSGWEHDVEAESVVQVCAREAYEEAGIGPQDLSCIELHDASAPSEIMTYDYLGICERGEAGALIADGVTRLGGRLPINTSGGLLRKGHPVGATGIAQIVELTLQLQGRAGERQVEGARFGLAQNAGGSIGMDPAASVVTILGREELG